jgi:putative ABC transport system substrate-binding protein
MRPFYKIVEIVVIVLFIAVVFVSTPSALETNATPLQSLFMIKQLIPQAQTVGVMWNQNKTNASELLPKIERASASTGVKVIVEDVEELSDVSQKFRELKDKYQVQAIWIIEDNDPMSSTVGKDFLVKNSIVNGIALFAPNTDWVSSGACAALLSDGSTVKLYVNKKTINALGIRVPDKYLQDTQFIATN